MVLDEARLYSDAKRFAKEREAEESGNCPTHDVFVTYASNGRTETRRYRVKDRWDQ